MKSPPKAYSAQSMLQPLTILLDSVFLTRPVVLIPVWAFAALGLSRARVLGGQSPFFWGARQITGLFVIMLFSLSVGAVYVVNQLADRDVDEMNGGFPLLVRGGLKTHHAIATALVCAIASLSVGFQDVRLTVAALASMALGLIYSLKPTFLSGRPIFDFLSNAVGFGVIAFWVGWIMVPSQKLNDGTFFLSSIPYAFLMCAGSISSTIPDMPGDGRGGKITTAVWMGEWRSHLLAMAFIVGAGVLSLFVLDWVALLCALIALPFYVAHLIVGSRMTMELTYKAGGASLVMIASVLMPGVLIGGAIVYFATWLYFRVRHGVSYPSLVQVAR